MAEVQEQAAWPPPQEVDDPGARHPRRRVGETVLEAAAGAPAGGVQRPAAQCICAFTLAPRSGQDLRLRSYG